MCRGEEGVTMKTLFLLGAAGMGCTASLAQTQNADERLRAVYTEEWKWRLEQFPGLEGPTKPVPNRLSKEDPSTQDMRLRHWEDVLKQLDAVPRTELSPGEQVNYDVFRPEIENAIANQRFRDY